MTTGLGATQWHSRAENKEHTLSNGELNQLAHDWGDPGFDPHGDPIPTSVGDLPPVGWEGRIVHLEDEPPHAYAELVTQGLTPGLCLRLLAGDGRCPAARGNLKRLGLHVDDTDFIVALAGTMMILRFAAVLWVTIVGANVPSAMMASVLPDRGHPALRHAAAAVGVPWWASAILIDGMYLTTAWAVSVMLPPMAIFFRSSRFSKTSATCPASPSTSTVCSGVPAPTANRP